MATVTVQRPAWNHLAHGGGERIAGGDIGGKLRFKYFRRPMVPYPGNRMCWIDSSMPFSCELVCVCGE